MLTAICFIILLGYSILLTAVFLTERINTPQDKAEQTPTEQPLWDNYNICTNCGFNSNTRDLRFFFTFEPCPYCGGKLVTAVARRLQDGTIEYHEREQ